MAGMGGTVVDSRHLSAQDIDMGITATETLQRETTWQQALSADANMMLGNLHADLLRLKEDRES